MGKKFITLASNCTRYRLYSDDIRTVFQKPIRKLPLLPQMPDPPHAADSPERRIRQDACSVAAAARSA